jgi:uncharacterized protein YecE (DUF72 family)
MQILAGTSGYAYKEWKGTFYPEGLKDAEMLRFYGRTFPTVEINNTFYRMPTAPLLTTWAGQVPEGFVFVLKAPQRITHMKRLKDAGEPLGHLLETAAALGPRLGPLLFQLPPHFGKDVPRLRLFLDLVPPGQPVAFEFRHDSWLDDETWAALRERNAAFVTADTEQSGDGGASVVPTADWGYLRLRRCDYGETDLEAWARRVEAQPWKRAFVFFKHEDAGTGPALARRFIALLRQ